MRGDEGPVPGEEPLAKPVEGVEVVFVDPRGDDEGAHGRGMLGLGCAFIGSGGFAFGAAPCAGCACVKYSDYQTKAPTYQSPPPPTPRVRLLTYVNLETMYTRLPKTASLLLLLTCCLAVPRAEAQLGDRLLKAAERGATRALERQAERKTAGAVDKTVDGATKPKKKRRRGERDEDVREEADRDEGTRPKAPSSGESTRSTGSIDTPSDTPTDAPVKTPFSTTSKYDFQPGPEVAYFDDFDRTELGDFPTGYNSSGTVEVMNVSTAPGKWLQLTQASGGLVLMDLGTLPENFTLEYDLIADVDQEGYRYNTSVTTVFTDTDNPEQDLKQTSAAGNHALTFGIKRGTSRGWATNYRKQTGRDGNSGSNTSLTDLMNEETRGTPHHVAFWRQGKRIRMYVDQKKVYDQQLAWTFEKPLAGIRLYTSAADGDAFYVSNFRLAKGKPDTRSKLEKEGKLTTYGLTFDSGSATLKASSAGTLKMIARVLKDNPDMQLKITGHTDADGSETSNQQLSEQRAAAVKQALVSGYAVKGNRLSTAGAGESDPIATGDDAASKAQNRRVVLEVE